MAKKYFWLKLKDDFFTDKKIKKLRKVAGGDTYTIIYLKMQLLSLKNDGLILFDDLESELYEEIALEIDEDEDNVKFTLLFLMKYGLVEEVDEKSIAMLETINNIGKESESANRVRALRDRRKQEALQCNVTEVTCNTEKEKEKEKEKDIKDIVPAKADTIPYELIVEHLNLKTGKNFKHQTPATRKLIKARWNEGNELDEFKKVIDTMFHNWKDDPKMKDYLQPSTLFSTKFENYLNQQKKQTFTNQQQNKAWEDDIYGNSTNSYDNGYNQQQLSKPNEQNRQQIILQQP